MKGSKGAIQAIAFALLLAGCDETTGPNLNNVPGYAISKVLVIPSSATILVPDTITTADRFQFDAIALGKTQTQISGIVFAWSTSDASVAVVDSTGMVTPVRPGTVEIIASAHKVGKAMLEIIPATQAVSVSPLRDTIYVDEPIVPARDTVRLTPEARDPFGQVLAGIAFSWQSTSTGVARVDPNGLVHANGLGVANVIVSANGQNASTQITVLPVVARVDLSTPALQVLAFDTLQLAAVARDYQDAPMGRTFTWTSSNPAVATVDINGQVMFLAAGSATITARTAFRTASITITALERRFLIMDAAEDYTCGLTPLGRGYCWGNADGGRTAAGADSTCFGQGGVAGCILPPKRMNRPDLAFTSISTGATVGCGIVTEQVYCWGSDDLGQIGNGLDGAGATPSVATVRNHRFTTVSAGGSHACALNLVGTAYCWGSDEFGQLGDTIPTVPPPVHSTTPIPVADTTLSFRAISAGAQHTCALTTAGAAYCWGNNSSGQLGNGGQANASRPVLVASAVTFTAISAGASHTCAIDTATNLHCWGSNSGGQLGLGIPAGGNQLIPFLVPGGGGYTAVSAGVHHSCGIATGAVRCWGSSPKGEVGDGVVNATHVVLAPVSIGLTASSVTVGRQHSCAITTAGVAMCWGTNEYGVLGNEYQAAIRATPQVVARPR